MVGVSQAAVARIEQGAFIPSEQLTQQFALCTGFPIAFFKENGGPDLPLGSLLYRKRNSLRSRDEDKIHQFAWATYKIYAYMAGKLRMPPVRLPQLPNESAETAAQIARSALGYELNVPLTNLINRLEKVGVLVLNLPLEVSECDAFSLWYEGKLPIIVLLNGKSGDRLRRNVAHEMSHLILHSAPTGSCAQLETEADRMTNEFITPERAMREEMITPITLSSLADLKTRWGVSIQSLIERAFELEIITPNQRRYLWRQISHQKMRQEEAVHIVSERPRSLHRMAELLFPSASGASVRVNYGPLAREVCLPVNLVIDIMSGYMGFSPEQATPLQTDDNIARTLSFPRNAMG
jgi:Zn-dependent peptidase ImmA (M78 family)